MLSPRAWAHKRAHDVCLWERSKRRGPSWRIRLYFRYRPYFVKMPRRLEVADECWRVLRVAIGALSLAIDRYLRLLFL
jgi:hypothetical protein